MSQFPHHQSTLPEIASSAIGLIAMTYRLDEHHSEKILHFVQDDNGEGMSS
jgi:hypothetical protein